MEKRRRCNEESRRPLPGGLLTWLGLINSPGKRDTGSVARRDGEEDEEGGISIQGSVIGVAKATGAGRPHPPAVSSPGLGALWGWQLLSAHKRIDPIPRKEGEDFPMFFFPLKKYKKSTTNKT